MGGVRRGKELSLRRKCCQGWLCLSHTEALQTVTLEQPLAPPTHNARLQCPNAYYYYDHEQWLLLPVHARAGDTEICLTHGQHGDLPHKHMERD